MAETDRDRQTYKEIGRTVNRQGFTENQKDRDRVRQTSKEEKDYTQKSLQKDG